MELLAELNYDDYAGIDVKNKIVLIEMEIPANSNHKDYTNGLYIRLLLKVTKCYKSWRNGLIFVCKIS